MNIAIMDYTLSKTHIRFNIANFEQLRKIANLYIVNCEKYYDEFASKYENVELYNPGIEFPDKQLNSFTGRLLYIHNMKLNAKLFGEYKNVNFDAIIIMGFEIITLSLYRKYIPKNIPVYIFQHQQLDELENPIKRFFFNTFKKSVHHIVLEEFYKEFMEQQYRVNNVHVVHYISYVNNADKDNEDLDQENLILAISGHNDERIVEQIINAQRNSEFLSTAHTKMYIRSAEHSYEDDYLFVGYEYLNADEYDQKFRSARAILAIIPDYFHHRVSGPVFDAVSSGKAILCSNKNVYKAYVKKAASVFRYFSNMDELMTLIQEGNWEVDSDEIKRLQKQYSPESICEEYKLFLQ